MIIIGERINGSRAKIGEAIAQKNAEYIQQEAQNQVNAGANYLDLNCATSLENELSDLEWLIKTVRKVTSTPLCLDSPNAAAIEKGLSLVKGEDVFVNSITLEPERIQAILPLIKTYAARVVALTMDEQGIPQTAQERVAIAKKIMERVREYAITEQQVYFDLLIQPVSTQQAQAVAVFDTLKSIKQLGWQTVCGLSNISFGLPKRTIINSYFFASVIALGIDAVIIDPTEAMMRQALLTMNILLNKDAYCRNYLKAMREKKL